MEKEKCLFPERHISHLARSIIWNLISLSLISITTLKKLSFFLLEAAETDMLWLGIARAASKSFCVLMILRPAGSCLTFCGSFPCPISLSVKWTRLLNLNINHMICSLLKRRVWPMGGIQRVSQRSNGELW